MPDRSPWPFYPSSLSEIIDPDTLAAIESGLSEQINRPLTILEMDIATGTVTRRIESIDEMHRYESICQTLRRKPAGNQLCLDWDQKQANISLQKYQQTGDPFRCFLCHVGLADMTYIIRVNSRPVAMLFTGQYCPVEGSRFVHKTIDMLGTPGAPPFPVEPWEKAGLHELADRLPALPERVRDDLEKKAMVIQQFAEAEFQLHKRQREQEFLDALRMESSGPLVSSRADLEGKLRGLLEKVVAFLRCEYLVFFSALMEDDTVLVPLAYTGVFDKTGRKLPHFNWRKAGLPLENFSPNNFQLNSWPAEARQKGIRGENRELLNNVAQIIPVAMGDRYRGALMFGPFTGPVDLEQEERFLREIANTIGSFALASTEVLYLEQERSWWRNTARLLTHQYKTGLTPIATDLGWAREIIQKPAREVDFKLLGNLLVRAEDLSMRLAESARETLIGTVSTVARNDLKIESYQLSALVGNCVNGFIKHARQENRELEMDKSVEMLPEAEVDVARVTVAIENIIENAIKYSFPDTRIQVRSRIEFMDSSRAMMAVIEITDQGREIRQDEIEYIFELGARGTNVLAAVKAKTKLGGSGLGLWETRSIVNAHGGKILASCAPTSNYRREGRVYNVVFSIYLPLKQNG